MLQKLYIENNQLTDLDLGLNTDLGNLTCEGNQLTSLNLTQSTNLWHLSCNNNQLTNLDLRNGNNMLINDIEYTSLNNPNLRCIFVDDVTYSAATWTQIDPASTFVETEAECDALAVSDFNKSSFRIYPNPAQDFINIQSEAIINNTIVYSINGQRLLQGSFNQIDISSLALGAYILMIEGVTGEINTQYFIKN